MKRAQALLADEDEDSGAGSGAEAPAVPPVPRLNGSGVNSQ